MDEEKLKRALALKEQGNDAYKEKRYHNAHKYYTQSLELRPSSAVYANRAQVFLHLQQWQLALRDCNYGLEMGDPSPTKLLFRRGQALAKLGMAERAVLDFERVKREMTVDRKLAATMEEALKKKETTANEPPLLLCLEKGEDFADTPLKKVLVERMDMKAVEKTMASLAAPERSSEKTIADCSNVLPDTVSSTVSPDPPSTVSPIVSSTGASPDPQSTVTPIVSSTVSPDPQSTVCPVVSSTVSPDPLSTVTPIVSSTVSPDPPSTVTPIVSSTVSPDPPSTVTPIASSITPIESPIPPSIASSTFPSFQSANTTVEKSPNTTIDSEAQGSVTSSTSMTFVPKPSFSPQSNSQTSLRETVSIPAPSPVPPMTDLPQPPTRLPPPPRSFVQFQSHFSELSKSPDVLARYFLSIPLASYGVTFDALLESEHFTILIEGYTTLLDKGADLGEAVADSVLKLAHLPRFELLVMMMTEDEKRDARFLARLLPEDKVQSVLDAFE